MRRFLAPVFALAALVCAPLPVSAQQTETIVLDQNLGWLGIGGGTKFLISIFDNVDDGCWTNAEAAKNAVAIELQRSGYKVDVSEESAFGSEILLYATGYEITDFTCVASYGITLTSLDISSWISEYKHKVNSLRDSELWRNGGILSGPKSGINRQIKDALVELAQQLLLDIPKERNEVLKAVREAAETNKAEQPEAYRYWMEFPD